MLHLRTGPVHRTHKRLRRPRQRRRDARGSGAAQPAFHRPEGKPLISGSFLVMPTREPTDDQVRQSNHAARIRAHTARPSHARDAVQPSRAGFRPVVQSGRLEKFSTREACDLPPAAGTACSRDPRPELKTDPSLCRTTGSCPIARACSARKRVRKAATQEIIRPAPWR